MTSIELTVNGRTYEVDAAPDTPLLWVLRDDLRLTGSKYGCGSGICGACTVHLDGDPARSCVVPISAAAQAEVTTIEGLNSDSAAVLHEAWLAEGVSQCGYCQPGQIMTAAALLARNSSPTEREITRAMTGNLCRCGTYPRIRRAVLRAARGGRS
jgi:aerobic-type carbon monoxide dehydrogenase small subunit (CoxS/CutS family)